jgi:signal transduction histidine kinase
LIKLTALKLFLGFLLVFFTVSFSKAQHRVDTAYIDIALIKQDSNIVSESLLFIDSSSELAVANVMQKTFSPLEDHLERKRLSPASIPFTYYLKFFVRNSSEKEISVYFYPGLYYKQIDLYKVHTQPVIIENNSNLSGYRKLTLAAGEACFALARLEPLKNEFNSIAPVLISDSYINIYKQVVAGNKTDIKIFGLIFSGILLMMILFMISNFIIAYKPEFLYNALYSFCMFFLIFFNSIVPRTTTPFTNFYYSYLDFFLLVAATVFYIRFTRKFLNTNVKYDLLDKVLKYSEVFIILLLCIYSYLHFGTSTYQPQFYLENIMKFLILAIGIAFIFLGIQKRDRLFNYIAAGNVMLILFSLISLLLIIKGMKATRIYYSSMFYYNIGIVLELFFFLLGLTYKNRSELIQGIKEQEALKLEAKKQEFETQIAVIKAQQEERNRISADMHDDLGAGMTTISLYSELAKSKLINNPIPEIDKISSSANELLNKMNAIIWSMSSSNDSLSNLIAYIRSYALEYFEDTGVNCKVSIPENLPNIEVIGEIRRNIFLVVKEALNNILKHAKATEVTIILTRVEDGLTLYIQDNGTGINMDNIRQFGNGLKNMKKRMHDVDIDFNIENKNGTLITLHRKIKTF